MIWRGLVSIAGLAVVGAATHANVMYAGGYGTADTSLIIAVAVLLAVGMGYAATEWRDGSKLGAFVLAVCLLSGEAYWLFLNADRELQARATAAAPAIEATEKRVKAEERVRKAEVAKEVADAAALSQAALKGCKTNCAKLLTDAKQEAATELEAARANLRSLPRTQFGTGLADNLGLARWAWDLVMAGLRSLAVVGGSIAIALAVHPRRHLQHSAVSAPEKAVPEPVTRTRTRPTPRKLEPLAITAQPVTGREHVSQFLRAILRPDPIGAASLRELHASYPDWCRKHAVNPLPPAELGQHLRSIVDAIGLEYIPSERDVIIRGAALQIG